MPLFHSEGFPCCGTDSVYGKYVMLLLVVESPIAAFNLLGA